MCGSISPAMPMSFRGDLPAARSDLGARALVETDRNAAGTQVGERIMAAVQGVRDFLEVLEKNGQLLRIAEEVSLEPDIGAAGRAISQLGETMPALNFEKIKGYKSAHIVTNIHGSWPNPWPRCLAPAASPVSPQSWSH